MIQMKIEAATRLKATSILASGGPNFRKVVTQLEKALGGEAETAKATVLSAATPKEAAQYVVKVFSKNGFKIKFSRNSSDPDMLVFDMVALGGKKFSFGLQLEGKTVSMDSLGEEIFDPTVFVADAVNKVDTTYLDFEKLGSAAFGKWEASIDNLAEQVGDAITRYKSFVERFNAAIAEITAEMRKGTGKGKK